MAQLSGSWGLALDLGDEVRPEVLEQLFAAVWQAPEFSGPRFKLGEYAGVPRAAEGDLSLSDEIQGSCYTKFEEDSLGYPPSWQVPLSFNLSVYGFAQNLPENQELYHFLLAKAREFAAVADFRMAMLGDLTCYYLNAEFLNEDWLDLQQQSVQALILPQRHPFARRHPGQDRGDKLWLYEREQLQTFWSSDDEGTRYLRFKQRLAQELHSPRIDLEWESPSQN